MVDVTIYEKPNPALDGQSTYVQVVTERELKRLSPGD